MDDCIEYPLEETGGIGDENRIRGNWSSKIDYFLSIFGLNLAFGNLVIGPALAVHRAEQFAMQIPEARKLIPYADI
jgi:hypothetical protein